MRIDLAAAVAALQARVEGTLPEFAESFSIDTRTLVPGAVFFAIQGENDDGHSYVRRARELGAGACVVSRLVENGGPQIVVGDTLAALQDLARWAMRQRRYHVVGITGSAGKTTTKEAVAAILGAARKTGKTQGNFNNHLGVPLSALHLAEDDHFAVLEMGMNHAGEIRDLAMIAPPEIAVVTNVGTAHIENFEDGIDGIARAKRELVEALPALGTAVLNADDPRVAGFAAAHPGRTILYGTSNRAQVRATDVQLTAERTEFRLNGGTRVQIPIPGRAGLMTALAALAAAEAAGLDAAALAPALGALAPPKMRAERLLHRGATVWNDCYNSNPEAARMMLEVLAGTPASRRIAVLGEMLELGRWSKTLHEEVGIYAASLGISVLVGIRGAARLLVDAARNAGLAADAAYFFEDPQAAGVFLRDFVQPGDALLFKGSRGTRVELALASFLAES